MAEEKKDKEKKSQKPSFWLGLIAVLAVLVIILSFWEPTREPISTTPAAGAKFPLVVWLIVVGGVLGLRAFTEIKKPGAPAVTFDMGCVALGFLTLMIIIFEVFCPSWWGNIWGTATGKLLLIGFLVGALLWYILPGTGKITVQSGKILSAIIVAGSLLMLIGIATQKDFAQGIQGIQEKGALRWSLTETKDLLWKSSLKPAPYVPTYQRITSREFVGKGFGGKETWIWTGWLIPDNARKGDVLKYGVPEGKYIETYVFGTWQKHDGPEIKINVLSDMGELVLRAPKGVEVSAELWGIR